MPGYKSPEMKEIEQNLHKLSFEDGRVLYLVGTAHVSSESVAMVERVINKYKPDTVCVELDEQRRERLMSAEKFMEIDLLQILKKKQLAFFIGQFIMSSFQRKIADQTGISPGSEFKRAIELAEERGAKVVLADRNLGITLRRAWRLTRLRDKLKLLSLAASDNDKELENLDIEALKKSDAITTMVGSFADELPETKKVLIDERDTHLTYMTQDHLGKKTVCVVGAGHVPGMLKAFKKKVPQKEKARINTVPKPAKAGKIIPWIIPALVLSVFVWGFASGRHETAKDALVYWVLANGILTAIGCLIAFAHPLTTLVGFIAAPITSLNPTIGAGFVTAFVQLVLVKPRVRDMEQIQTKTLRFRDWWSNRITKVFLVFVLSSIGSSIGTFVALPLLTKLFGSA